MKQPLKSTRTLSAKEPEILISSQFIVENLPLPYVLYPNIGGTFLGFSSSPEGDIFFCTCAYPAIENYLQMYDENRIGYSEFPPKIVEKAKSDMKLEGLLFKAGLCHKCNFATPTVRAINPMYGGRFLQYYGWYVKQQHLQLGFYNNEVLKSKCPNEILELWDKLQLLNERANHERQKLNELVNGPKRDDIAEDEITYWSNVKLSEAELYRRLEKESNQLYRQFSNIIENMVRADFGFRNVGEGWISESILHKIVSKLFPNKEILRHYRPEWLSGLELDIYIPELQVGFEYQGKQHYFPIKAWGGVTALAKVKERDAVKRKMCEELGINLIVVPYTDPLTEEHIKGLL